MIRRIIVQAALCVAIAAGFAPGVHAQPAGRTLEELKAEAQVRADRNAYPLIGLKPDEVREALARLHSLDRDEWAAAFFGVRNKATTSCPSNGTRTTSSGGS